MDNEMKPLSVERISGIISAVSMDFPQAVEKPVANACAEAIHAALPTIQQKWCGTCRHHEGNGECGMHPWKCDGTTRWEAIPTVTVPTVPSVEILREAIADYFNNNPNIIFMQGWYSAQQILAEHMRLYLTERMGAQKHEQ